MKRRLALRIVSTAAAAVALGACSSSGDPTGQHGTPFPNDNGPPEAGALEGAGSGPKLSEASVDVGTSEASTPPSLPADGGTAEEGVPEDGVVDAGTPDTLEGEGGLMVTWTLGCWYTDSGMKYQAMSFSVESSTPLPLEGTLFYDTTCDASMGTDNLNDTGGTTPSGSWIFWFIHHPGEIASSAIWSYGGIKSGCIDYGTAPDCP